MVSIELLRPILMLFRIFQESFIGSSLDSLVQNRVLLMHDVLCRFAWIAAPSLSSQPKEISLCSIPLICNSSRTAVSAKIELVDPRSAFATSAEHCLFVF